MMIIYEITTIVSAGLITRYEKYMCETHIPDLLATGYFARVYFTRSSENRYRIQYHAHSQKTLDDYLEKDAPRLREDFSLHFPQGIEVSRENWEILEIFLLNNKN
jgi:Domain of unknown function (DUF4286)